MKIDLNAPAFGQGSQKPEDLVEETEQTVAEPAGEETKEQEPEASEEESKVPYSRFKKFHDRALDAEREAELWRTRAESFKSEPVQQQTQTTNDMPAYWLKLYGDSDASMEAWLVQKQANEEIINETRRAALDAVHNERYEEQARTDANIATLDENFEDLQAFVGRDLTDAEQSAVLDIVDDYTPKDAQGNYAGATLPFDKAWEIYELKNTASKAPRAKARDNVANLTGTPTQGDAGSVAEQEKSFNPLDWNAFKKRL